MNRREIRDHKYKLLFFLYDKDEDYINRLVDFYFDNLPIEDEEEDYNPYVKNNRKKTGVQFLEIDKQEVKDFLKSFSQKRNIIDDYIKKAVIDWDINRIPKEELNLLRLTTYEMYFDDRVLVNIAINEAVMLANVYGNTDKSSRFINAILSNMYKINKNDK